MLPHRRPIRTDPHRAGPATQIRTVRRREDSPPGRSARCEIGGRSAAECSRGQPGAVHHPLDPVACIWWAPWTGVAALLAIVAAMSFALAATLWQKASMDAGVEPGDSKGLLGLLTNKVWLLGLLAQGVGVALQAAALDRGRVAIIQPLLVTSIVWALPLGYFMTNQVITRRHIVGAAIIVVGLATFTTVGDPAAGVDNAPTSDWISALVGDRRGLHRADAVRPPRRPEHEGRRLRGDGRHVVRRRRDADEADHGDVAHRRSRQPSSAAGSSGSW